MKGTMMFPGEDREYDAGSRMHVLEWLESQEFLPLLRGLVAPIGFTVLDDAAYQPKGRHDHRESVLVGLQDPFLSAKQQAELKDWWLVHKKGFKLPTWDLVVSAFDATKRGALILVEAKAHASELSAAAKPFPSRAEQEQQERSEENHARIADAIAEANAALQAYIPSIRLSRDDSYQLSNRIAFAWKLASLGLPTALVYLGFIGDNAIGVGAHRLPAPSDWYSAFDLHSAKHFPPDKQGSPINCGAASFWPLVRDMPVLRNSPPIDQRRILK
jgi:hypothetical protein